MWLQPREDKMGWVTEGLVNHVENFGYHLKNDGKLSTGFGLGVTRSGSCFERVFLLVGVGVGDGHKRTKSGNKETDLQCVPEYL